MVQQNLHFSQIFQKLISFVCIVFLLLLLVCIYQIFNLLSSSVNVNENENEISDRRWLCISDEAQTIEIASD